MLQTSRQIFVTLALAGGLSACGSKANTAEQTAQAATAPAETTAMAATPASASAPAPAETTAPEAAATFDLNSVPVTSATLSQFPYLSGIKGYSVSTSNSEIFDFDRSYLYDGKALIPVEGKVSRRFFSPDESDKKASELMIQRNYEELLKGLGATKVYSGKISKEALDKVGQDEAYKHGKWTNDTDRETETYVIRQKDKEIWTQVTPLGSDGGYVLSVTERTAMPQQAGLLKADELKKN
jgi:hypothetical protein